MKTLMLLATTALLSMNSAAFCQTEQKPSVPTIPATQIEPRKVATALEFVATASSANSFEIDAAKLALKRAQAPELKAFAQRMIEAHSPAQEELLAIAKSGDKTKEFAEPAPDGEQQGILAKLASVKDGPDFDKMYIEGQIYVHQRAISLLKGYSDGDSDLNRFAAKTLPTIIDHYQMAQELGSKLNVKAPAQ
ncbi:DUF4142 domain-containing protein [Mesorhizobium loti]|nr:DUF4142 domain-containing protein [Mesorhizobium loti]